MIVCYCISSRGHFFEILSIADANICNFWQLIATFGNFWQLIAAFVAVAVQHFDNALAGVGEGSEDLCGLPGKLPAWAQAAASDYLLRSCITPTSRKQVLALHDDLDYPLLDEGVLSSSSVI